MIQAKILLDSVNPKGDRLVTWELTYPRFIHAEFMTHRVFSRNASSSRAIPVTKMIERVRATPAMPISWGKNKKGMQAEEELDEGNRLYAEYLWLKLRDQAIETVESLNSIKTHKQIVNRLLEPWLHMVVICSATEFDNWFKLRTERFAQPEIRALALAMLDLYKEKALLQHLQWNEWHIPMILSEEQSLPLETRLKISTARCARTSYLTHDGRRDYTEDVRLHDELVQQCHWSPFEHCASAFDSPLSIGNLVGWYQYRKQFVGEDGKGDLRWDGSLRSV